MWHIEPETCVASEGDLGDAREARELPGAPRGPVGEATTTPTWFSRGEQTRRPDADRADTLPGRVATRSYDNTRFALARESGPFWSHREEGLAMSTAV